MQTLTIGYSPCPNDTYIFGALALGLVSVPGVEFKVQLEDVETLNQLAKQRRFDITKVSYAAWVNGLPDYQLLPSGGALGRGCGPLVVARSWCQPDALQGKRIVTPGPLTTAHLLMRLFAPHISIAASLPFDQIMPAVASGCYEAGVIIHESRFTFGQFGLYQVVDLGDWWEKTTGKPIPLGGIVAKRSLGEHLIHQVNQGIVQSLTHAWSFPDSIQPYIAQHAQEMDQTVQTQHIQLYVNEFTRALGLEGQAAVEELLARAQSLR